MTKRTYTFGTPYERALHHIEHNGDGCWIWTGAQVPAGYGHINCGGGVYKHAHIVIYEHHHGPVPDGLELDHLCRVRACVNPDHLEPVPHVENVRRGDATGSNCDHPDNRLKRYPSGPREGRIAYCRDCRNERRRKGPTAGICRRCGDDVLGRSDKQYCGDRCRRAARTDRDREARQRAPERRAP